MVESFNNYDDPKQVPPKPRRSWWILWLGIALVLCAGILNGIKSSLESEKRIREMYAINEKLLKKYPLIQAQEKRTFDPGIVLVKIPEGEVLQGSEEEIEKGEKVNRVKIKNFWLGETEVTIQQYVIFLNEVKPKKKLRQKWVAINGEKSVCVKNGEVVERINTDSHIKYKDDHYCVDDDWENNPVVNVSWYGAEAFCSHYGLRLPTAEEWIVAAGGPEQTKWSLGNEFVAEDYCFSGNPGPGKPPTMKVKSFRPDGYGLYNMSGNVGEWCADRLSYINNLIVKELSKEQKEQLKGSRGGSWAEIESYLKCNTYGELLPSMKCNFQGFRAARSY